MNGFPDDNPECQWQLMQGRQGGGGLIRQHASGSAAFRKSDFAVGVFSFQVDTCDGSFVVFPT